MKERRNIHLAIRELISDDNDGIKRLGSLWRAKDDFVLDCNRKSRLCGRGCRR